VSVDGGWEDVSSNDDRKSVVFFPYFVYVCSLAATLPTMPACLPSTCIKLNHFWTRSHTSSFRSVFIVYIFFHGQLVANAAQNTLQKNFFFFFYFSP
jgi:hypothetical protein